MRAESGAEGVRRTESKSETGNSPQGQWRLRGKEVCGKDGISTLGKCWSIWLEGRVKPGTLSTGR